MKQYAIFIIALLACVSLGAMQPEEFECYRTLTAPDSSTGELAAYRLDSRIYRSTVDGFADMRIFDDSGKEIAFVVRTVNANDTHTVRYPIHLESESFKEVKGGGASVVFSRSEQDSIPTRLTIFSGVKNFEKSVAVLGSNDLKTWKVLAENQPIFDYSQFIDIRNTTVEFERADFRYYKVRIDSVWNFKRSAFSRVVRESSEQTIKAQFTEFMQIQEPFRLDRIEFGGEAQRIRYGEPVVYTAELRIGRVAQDTTERTTSVYLSSDREPVSTLELAVSGSNFMRQVSVHGTNDPLDENGWKLIGSAQILSISTGDYERNELQIPVSPASRYIYYRLTIYNRDNAPLQIAAVKGKGPRHEALFFHRGEKQLTVNYGADSAQAPQYDIGTVLHKAPVTSGALWTLGEEKIRSVKENAASPVNPKYILMGVLGLMVVVLVAVLGVAMRKVDEKTEA